MTKSSKPLGPELYTHNSYMSNAKAVSLSSVGFGDVISFQYENKTRHVFVFTPNWENKLHGIDLTHMSRNTLLREIIPVMDNTDDPYIFYKAYINKSLITLLDCYRIFKHDKITRMLRYRYEIDDIQADGVNLQVNENSSLVSTSKTLNQIRKERNKK